MLIPPSHPSTKRHYDVEAWHYDWRLQLTSMAEKLNTRILELLEHKQPIKIIGHSMGGMLLTRFAVLYPDVVEKLIYENPIGLEDYSAFVPRQSIDSIYQNELKSNYESLKKYHQTYYPTWKSSYEQYVAAQYATLQTPDFKTAAYASALTYQMIVDQPVINDFKNIKQPALIVIGQLDRTVVGKNLLSKEEAQGHGYYPKLGKFLKNQIPQSSLVEFSSIGHIPHVQVPGMFEEAVLHFLRKQ